MEAGTRGPSRDKSQVLIVEDDPAVRRSMQLLLQGQGFDVRAYGSAEALLADGAFEQSCCLIADYKMQGLDGINLLSRLRERGWQGKAVLVTAFPSSQLADQAIAAGYTAVFEKPLRERSLVEAIRRLMPSAD